MIKSSKTKRGKIITKRHRPQRFIGFKVFEDTDYDMIEWWQGIEPGKGSDLLRQIIRDYMYQQDMSAQNEIAKLSEQIELLRRELLTKLDNLTVAQASKPAIPFPKPEPRISKEEAEERKKNILKQKW